MVNWAKIYGVMYESEYHSRGDTFRPQGLKYLRYRKVAKIEDVSGVLKQ